MFDCRGRVLIVDDDRHVTKGLSDILHRYLFHVRVAHAVERGVHLARARRRERREAACQLCRDERWLVEAFRRDTEIAPWDAHFGLVAVPYGLPQGLLLWLAGCHEESSGLVLTLDCAEVAPEHIEERLFEQVEFGAGQTGLVRRLGSDRDLPTPFRLVVIRGTQCAPDPRKTGVRSTFVPS